MGKNLDIIKQIQEILEYLTGNAESLLDLSDELREDNLELSNLTIKFAEQYSKINYDFASKLVFKTFEAHKKDNEVDNFNDIIKNIKKESEDEK